MKTLLQIATQLKSENNKNPEYDRALVEFLTEALGLTMDHKNDVAELLDIKLEVH
ncbi:MAG: hypothetical protein WC444_06245 [Candidatus Paceibacterota bacterium]